jgi:hypothetical protein
MQEDSKVALIATLIIVVGLCAGVGAHHVLFTHSGQESQTVYETNEPLSLTAKWSEGEGVDFVLYTEHPMDGQEVCVIHIATELFTYTTNTVAKTSYVQETVQGSMHTIHADIYQDTEYVISYVFNDKYYEASVTIC